MELCDMNGMIHKRILLAGCFLLMASSLYAQYEYQPFVKEGKTWNIWGSYDRNDYSHDFQYLMQGDTIIGDEVMKKVHLIDEFHFHDNNLHYIGAVKEADKQVYITYDGKDTPMLLYDFNLKPSSFISYGENYTFKIQGVYLYQINSTLRYEQYGQRQYPPEVTEVIPMSFTNYEGIGCVMGLDPFQLIFWGRNEVISCYEDGVCIFYYRELGSYYHVEPTYVPLLKHRRSWITHDATSGKDIMQIVQGDTIFPEERTRYFDYLYRKVYCVDRQKYGDEEPHYYGAMREEGEKVYLIPNGKEKDDRVLLFDFGLMVGEKVVVAGSAVKVTESDSIISEGRKYHRLTLHLMEDGKDTGRTCHWTEGIGSESGLLLPLSWDSADNLGLVVNDDNTCIYDKNGIVTTMGKQAIRRISSTSQIIDLQGRLMDGQPRKGIYIQDGKKTLVK